MLMNNEGKKKRNQNQPLNHPIPQDAGLFFMNQSTNQSLNQSTNRSKQIKQDMWNKWRWKSGGKERKKDIQKTDKKTHKNGKYALYDPYPFHALAHPPIHPSTHPPIHPFAGYPPSPPTPNKTPIKREIMEEKWYLSTRWEGSAGGDGQNK